MAPIVHGLEVEYYNRINFVYLDVDDPANDNFLKQLGWSLIPSLGGAAVIMFVFGILLYYWGINPLLKKPGWGMSTVIFTLGLSIVINNLLVQTFGPRFKYIPKFIKGSIKISGIRIPWHDISLIIIVILFFIAFILKT